MSNTKSSREPSRESAKSSREPLHFTKKAIEDLPAAEKRYNIFDTDTRGLGVAVYTSGTKTFFHLRKVQGWPKRTTIGLWPETTIELARGKAAELNGKLAKWKVNNFEGASPLQPSKRVSNLGEVLDHYIEHQLKEHAKNPETAAKYAQFQFSTYLADWRNHPLATISRADVIARHAEIKEAHGGVTANRTITFLRTLLNHAIHPDVDLWQGTNPVAKPKKFLFHEVSRKTVLQDSDAQKFFKALERERHKDLHDFILIALSTAARRGTIFAMRWDQIDFQRALWIIPNPKGKRGVTEHIVPLNAMAMDVLESRPRTGEWVFPGKSDGRHLKTIAKPWKAFLKRAGIEGLHVHDLRRTVATRQGESGASTRLIQKTLGHTDDSVATRIYDRSEQREDVREAIDAAMQSMLAAGKSSKRKLLAAHRG